MKYDRELQLALTVHNRCRFSPGSPLKQDEWQEKQHADFHFSRSEEDWLSRERAGVSGLAAQVPRHVEGFIRWFEGLKMTGPGQNDVLFPWLSEHASFEQMRWFVQQEVAGEAGFDDLVALSQVRIPTRAKLEMARNYWDEMGRGSEKGMHGLMLHRLAEELNIAGVQESGIVTEALALSNLLVGFAANRRYAYHSVGALGVIELTAPTRASLVHEGLRRLGISAEGRRYYLLHSTLDVKHSEAWNREILAPLVSARPDVAPWIAEGALLRLEMGRRCFERYRQEFGVTSRARECSSPDPRAPMSRTHADQTSSFDGSRGSSCLSSGRG